MNDEIKLEVGKTYELNNGNVYQCTEMYGDDPLRVDAYGYGPFVVNNVFYHQDGRFADGKCPELDVKRCLDDPEPAPEQLVATNEQLVATKEQEPTSKDKLVQSLLGNYHILDGFVVVGLEQGLQNILEEIELILQMSHIPDHKWQDLVDLCYDGKAFVRVLRYHNTHTYDEEMVVINKGFDKQREWI